MYCNNFKLNTCTYFASLRGVLCNVGIVGSSRFALWDTRRGQYIVFQIQIFPTDTMYYLHAFNIFSIKSTVYTEICIGYTLDISERTGVFSSSIYILHK